MVDESAVLAEVAAALGRVLDVTPAVIRADTPVADLGADNLALVAAVDLVLSGHAERAGAAIFRPPEPPRPVSTVGDLVAVLMQGRDANDGHT